MNHKSLFILFFVLIFCLSSTVASRRLLPGNEGIPMRPNHSGTAPSATELPPPQGNKRIPTRPNHSKPDHSATDPHPPQGRCNGIYGSCIIHSPTVFPRGCDVGNRCRYGWTRP